MGRNTFQMPFSGQRDMLESLRAWGATSTETSTPQFFPRADSLKIAQEKVRPFQNFIALAPSAAYPLKRWPLEYWKRLIQLMPKENFVLLGGPGDSFLNELTQVDSSRVLNLAGACDLMTSSSVITLAKALVANDTGLMHIGEQTGKPTVALMGPAPFGFPSRKSTQILERNLPCRPCSKHGQGPCTNPNFHQCLVDIPPEEVVTALKGFRL
jgi:ADP-heptose:LPS heptosyltransferase